MIDKIKEDIKKYTLAKDAAKTDLLKLVVADYEYQALKNKNASVENVIKSIIQNNNICLKHRNDEKYVKENELLSSYLPKYATVDELVSHLKPLGLDDSGQSMGKAMKFLKENAVAFENSSVKEALKKLNEAV